MNSYAILPADAKAHLDSILLYLSKMPMISSNKIDIQNYLVKEFNKIVYNHDYSLFDDGWVKLFSQETQNTFLLKVNEFRKKILEKFLNNDILLRALNAAIENVCKNNNIQFKKLSISTDPHPKTNLCTRNVSEWKIKEILYGQDSKVCLYSEKRYEKNKESSPIISIVALQHDKNQQIRISVDINKNFYTRFIEIIKKYNVFKLPEFPHKDLNIYITLIIDDKHIRKFMDLLIELDTTVDVIKENILETANPLLKKTKNRSFESWQRYYNFTLRYTESCNLIRSAKYTRLDSSNVILNLHLLGDSGNTVYVSLEPHSAHKDTVFSQLKLNDFKLLDIDPSQKVLILNRDHLIKFLNALVKFDIGIKEILDDIVHLYDPKFVEKQKVSFLMGLHKRLGEKSSIAALKNNKLFDYKNIIGSIFKFLPPPITPDEKHCNISGSTLVRKNVSRPAPTTYGFF